MKQVYKNIWNVIKQYPFTFLAVCGSFLMSIIMIYFALEGWSPTIDGWLFIRYYFVGLIPSSLFVLTLYFLLKDNKQDNRYIRGCALFFWNIINLVIQIIVLFIIALYVTDDLQRSQGNNPKRYQETIKSFNSRNTESIAKVFPSSIPINAKNVKIYAHKSLPGIVYYETIKLSFIIPVDYINKEEKRFKGIKPIINTIENKNIKYTITGNAINLKYLSRHNNILDDDYKFLSKLEYPDVNHQNYLYCGCSINKDTNEVSYIYSFYSGDYCPNCYEKEYNYCKMHSK